MSERRRLDRVGGLTSKRRDCRGRKCMTELHGGVYHHTSTPHKGGNMILTLTRIFIYAVKQNIRDVIGQ